MTMLLGAQPAADFARRETELMFDIEKLGDEGKFSIMAIKKKFGPPTKIEKFNSKEGAKIVAYQQLHYPPLSFLVAGDSDQASSIAAPKRLWAGKGILENAKAALNAK